MKNYKALVLTKEEYKALRQFKRGKIPDEKLRDDLRTQQMIVEIPTILEAGIVKESIPKLSIDGERYLQYMKDQRLNRALAIVSAVGAAISAIVGLLNYIQG